MIFPGRGCAAATGAAGALNSSPGVRWLLLGLSTASSPWQGNAGEILEKVLCRTALNSTNCIWISSGCFFHFEQEFTGTESSIIPSCLLQGHFHHEKQSPVLLPDIFIMNVLSGSWSDTDLSRDVSLDLSSLPAPVGIFPSPLSQLTWPSCG